MGGGTECSFKFYCFRQTVERPRCSALRTVPGLQGDLRQYGEVASVRHAVGHVDVEAIRHHRVFQVLILPPAQHLLLGALWLHLSIIIVIIVNLLYFHPKAPTVN